MLLHDFTPLSRPLVLSKILINIEEQEIVPHSSSSDSDASDSAESTPVTIAPTMTVTDYSKMTQGLFFRVYEGSSEDEMLLFDQLDLNSRTDSQTGMPMMSIGDAMVTVNSTV